MLKRLKSKKDIRMDREYLIYAFTHLGLFEKHVSGSLLPDVLDNTEYDTAFDMWFSFGDTGGIGYDIFELDDMNKQEG